jgi:hypothetical protein
MSTLATPNQKLLVGIPANSSERVLVNHPTQSATAIDGWKSVFFGLPFFAAGIFIEAVALDFVGGSKHAPNWLIGLIGFFFFAAGAFLILHDFRGVVRKSKYDREARNAPHEPWLYDHRWPREGISFSAFNAMLQRFVAALVWNAFLIPFFWIGLAQRGAWVFALFAGLFALIGLVFWFRWAQMLAELFRYGNTFLDYNAFPYFLGNTLSARLRAPNHLADIDELTITLRCVEERYITSGANSDRQTNVVCFELYCASKTFSRSELAAYSNQTIPIEFPLPDSQPGTSLTSTPPTYWEIEANGKSTKVNLQAFFLVPVYKAT